MRALIFIIALLACGEGVNPIMDVVETPPAAIEDGGVVSPVGPWEHCVRHQKSQGHGKGLEKSCR